MPYQQKAQQKFQRRKSKGKKLPERMGMPASHGMMSPEEHAQQMRKRQMSGMSKMSQMSGMSGISPMPMPKRGRPRKLRGGLM